MAWRWPASTLFYLSNWTDLLSTRWSLRDLDAIFKMQFQSCLHYCDVTMTMMASQITSLTVVYLIVYSDADQRKHQSVALLAFVRGIHRWPVNSPHKGPVTRKNVSIWWRRHDWLVSADLIIMPYRCMPTHNEQWACAASRSSLFT